MLEILGLLLGVIGVVFAFETPRRKFVNFLRVGVAAPAPPPAPAPAPAAVRSVSTPAVTRPSTVVFGATQSGRTPFFISEPLSDLAEAKAKSHETGKPLFLVIYDDEHPTRSRLDYSLGCFLDYFTTKRLVEQHFVSALVPVTAPGARTYVPEDDPLENALLVVLGPNGEVLRREGVYANQDEGMKRVRSVIAQLADA